MYNMRFVVTRQGYAAAIIFLFVVSKKKNNNNEKAHKRRHYSCMYLIIMCCLNCKTIANLSMVSKELIKLLNSSFNCLSIVFNTSIHIR